MQQNVVTMGFNPYAMHPGEVREVYAEAWCEGSMTVLRNRWLSRVPPSNAKPSYSRAPSETIIYRGL